MDQKTTSVKIFFLIVSMICFTILMNCERKRSQSQSLESSSVAEISSETRVEAIRKELLDSRGKQVLVVAHRGDWRHAPENSVQAIKNCIEMGVDMVEIDVRRTKDGQLVVIHDETIDRTTTGSGLVSDWTLDSLRTLYLVNGIGRPTEHRIPTLEEAMLAAKGKLMVNLDKCYDLFEEAFEILEKTGTTDHIIVKGDKPAAQVQKDLGQYLDKVLFMPIIRLNNPKIQEIIDGYHSNMKPVAMELVFASDTSRVLNNLKEMKDKGSRAWINSLWPSLNGGHDDDRAVYDLPGSYDWIINKGATMIQTDRPHMLLEYLRKKGLHD